MPLQSYQSKPLPDNARKAVYASLNSCGFNPKTMIVEDYAFSSQDRNEVREVRTNAVVFSHKIHRTPDYTGVTLFNPGNGKDERTWVQLLAQSAAPFHLIHQDESKNFSFWFSNVNDRRAQEVNPNLIESNIGYDQLHQVLNAYATDLKPQRIIDVKQRRAEFSHPLFCKTAFQLSFWAIEVTRDLLVKHFAHVVNQLANYRDSTGSAIPKADVTDIAVQLLGAAILSHTGVLGDAFRQQDSSIDHLIDRAYTEYPDYFDPNLFERWDEVCTSAYKILTELRYSGFAPDMLTALYKEAYPDKAIRRKLGRYDTPLYLTRRIWETIPVEFLPPDKRVIVDMTCGWGSFLIAGHERLSQMIDMQERPLRKYIHGNDKDRFTARLASLSLLISTLEDSWHVDDQDAMEWRWLGNRRPNIIVGNPPFGGDRRTIKDQKNRYQEADKYLERAIERLADGGYLAMLMPQSFVAAEASPKLRKKLLETCDVQELWDLPKGTFDAGANAVFILAQKKAISVSRIFPIRVRIVQKNPITNFEETGIFTASSMVSDQSSWGVDSRQSKSSKNTHIMDYQLILPEYSWDKIKSHCTELIELTEIFDGAIEGKNPAKKCWKNYPKPKQVDWLTDAKKVIKDPFNIAYDSAKTIIYPNQLTWPRLGKEHLLAGKKVLLTSHPDPSWGKRTKVAIERNGNYVSNHFYVIVPRCAVKMPYVTHEVVASILDWYVSNAWIVEHLRSRWILKRTLESVPFPIQLSEKDCETLTEAVRAIEKAVSANQERPVAATQAIDEILKVAYQLDDETFERLRLVAEWDTNPQITLDEQLDPKARWQTSGIVDNIDAKNGTITFWLRSFDELQTVPISPVMPGWLLRPEVAFRTSIPRQCVRQRHLANVSWGKFYPQDYTYLSEEELFDDLTDILSTPTEPYDS